MRREELHAGRVGTYGVETVTLPNGQTVALQVLRPPGAAAVLPIHDDGTITLLRQHRHCAGGELWEIPAGKLDPGEGPMDCASRELAEEAGLAGELRPLTAIFTAPAFTDERIHLYVATALRPVPAAPEADEVLTPVRMPYGDALAMVERGEIVDAKTVCALLLGRAHARGR